MSLELKTFQDWAIEYRQQHNVVILRIGKSINVHEQCTEDHFRSELLPLCTYDHEGHTTVPSNLDGLRDFAQQQTGIQTEPIDLRNLELDQTLQDAVDALIGLVENPEIHDLTPEEHSILQNSIFMCFRDLNSRNKKIHATTMVFQIINGAMAMWNLDDYEGLARLMQLCLTMREKFVAEYRQKFGKEPFG